MSSKPTSCAPDEIERLLASISSKGSVFSRVNGDLQRPVYGTTIFIASCTLEMRMGNFIAYVFQDISHRGYVVALTYGDIRSAKRLHTRVHSSCVTSETLRGVDCDCVQQLEGALVRIAEKGCGILFYFMQEGRGVGYIAKSRDRMLVQASRDCLSTFAAYAAMGLKKDYRTYDSISSICHLLGIDAEFIVMTNNPEKVSSLEAQGLRVAGTETIEYEPGPYNLAYLSSKQQSGHTLTKAREQYTKSALPPEEVSLFTPYALQSASRFIHVATYFLPMKPIDDQILIDREQYDAYFGKNAPETFLENKQPLILNVRQLADGERYLVTIHKQLFRQLKQRSTAHPLINLLTTPYWFKLHVYYDVVSWEEFVVLAYGEPKEELVPVVRLHSRSLFNSFPLENVDNRDRYKKAAMHIIENGYGMLILLDNDGRGAGFGAHASDNMLRESGVSPSTDESYRLLGVDYESRDYDAGITLLRHHLVGNSVQMVMNSPDSIVRKTEYATALHAHHIRVQRWIFLEH